MIKDLRSARCGACEGGTPPLNERQVERYHQEIPTWTVSENKKISKTFTFTDFCDAMVFVNNVAGLAEAEGHHPDIFISWNRVVLTLATHAIGGLSENDFILAAKVDQLITNNP